MKKSILTLALIVSVSFVAFSQTWNSGPSSGTLGTNNSFFGSFSGNSSTASTSDNVYIGFSSGRLTTSGIRNSGLGSQALYSNTAGHASTAIGYKALYTNNGNYNTALGGYSLQANTIGTANTASGYISLYSNTSGVENSAFGTAALYTNVSGSYNTAIGKSALEFNTTASENTAVGYRALYSNSFGTFNTAIGNEALRNNNGASNNTAIGYKALYTNTSGTSGVAIGNGALYSDTYGGSVAIGFNALYNANTAVVGRNVAVGTQALLNTTSGYRNTGIGTAALVANTTGAFNIATGYFALGSNTTGNSNSAFGDGALGTNVTGHGNSAFGSSAGPQSANLSNTTTLGGFASTSISNKVRLGNSSVTVIEGQVGYSIGSDGRFKKEIKEDVTGLKFINMLRPVSYIFDLDAYDIFQGIPQEARAQIALTREKPTRQTGFIAQEVDQALKVLGTDFSGLVRPKNEKDNYGIRYAEFVVPLVKAIQELSAKVEEQQETINALLLKGDSTEKSESNSQGIMLYDNNPNPFSNETEIKLRLPESTKQASIIVYNMEGGQLKSFPVNTRGETAVKISASELKAGMYLYSLIVDGKFIDAKRMILTR